MNITLIEGSPRRGGNTAQMAQMLADHLWESDTDTVQISVAEHPVAPCTGCNLCMKTGDCVLSVDHDTMLATSKALDSCDALLWVSPLYFASVPSQLKALIDRFQIYYARRLLHGQSVGTKRPAAAVLLGAGGDPFGSQSATLTLRSASQMAGFSLTDPLVISGPEAPGDIASARFAFERAAAFDLADALRKRVGEKTQKAKRARA